MENNIQPAQPQNGSKKKKYIITGVVLFVLIAGLIAGLILVGSRQLFKQEAAVPGGVATVSITPTQSTIAAGETISANVYFNTTGRQVNAMTVQLEYPFTGASPPITVSDNIQIDPALVADDWTFPIKSVATVGNKIVIKIGGFNQFGYTSAGDTKLATLTFTGVFPGKIIVSFNPTESKITDVDQAEDILLIPSSTGTYIVSGVVEASPTSAPTTSPEGSPESSPTAAPGTSPSPTPENDATPTATPTPASGGIDDSGGGGTTTTTTGTTATAPPLPDSGVSLPTIIGISAGLLLIIPLIILAI
jgi:hypothetical protein